MPRDVFSGAVTKDDGQVLTGDELTDMGLFGDGSDGSYTSGNNLQAGTVYNFTDLTLSSGDTLTVSSTPQEKPIVVKVKGNCTIDGTIDLKGVGFSGGSGGYDSNGRTSEGNAGTAPEISSESVRVGRGEWETGTYEQPYEGYEVPPMAGAPGITVRETEGDYARSGFGGSLFDQRNMNTNFPRYGNIHYKDRFNLDAKRLPNVIKYVSPGASGGGGSGGGDEGDNDQVDGGAGGGGGASIASKGFDGNTNEVDIGSNSLSGGFGAGGAGGDSGGAIIFIVGGDLSISGTIDVRGNDGEDGEDADSSAGGGGGGGAGGTAWLLYNGSLTDNATKNASGGSGGAGGTHTYTYGADGADGGAGGNGEIKIQSVN